MLFAFFNAAAARDKIYTVIVSQSERSAFVWLVLLCFLSLSLSLSFVYTVRRFVNKNRKNKNRQQLRDETGNTQNIYKTVKIGKNILFYFIVYISLDFQFLCAFFSLLSPSCFVVCSYSAATPMVASSNLLFSPPPAPIYLLFVFFA